MEGGREEGEEEGEGEGGEDVWEHNPSLSEMVEFGVPPEYLVILVISFCICVAVIGTLYLQLIHSTYFTVRAYCFQLFV